MRIIMNIKKNKNIDFEMNDDRIIVGLQRMRDSWIRSKEIYEDLGFDLSKEAIISKTNLPSPEEWHQDKKLAGFSETMIYLKNQAQIGNYEAAALIPGLEIAIKNSRSQSIASIRGNMLEEAVSNLGNSLGATLLKQVDAPELSNECIDVQLTKNKKIMNIMCQVDLWSGGAQRNRCDKYLNLTKSSLISLVWNEPPKIGNKKTGSGRRTIENLVLAWEEGRLMWLWDLKNAILSESDND